MKLSELKTGESGVIVKVSGHGGFRKRVIEMGFIKGKKVDEKELNQVLKVLGLEHKKDRFANELSGGQQQRVAIGRAILAHTDIILADEPTGNLDGENAKNVMDILKALNKEGKTIVLVTHDLKIANYADRIIRLEQGKIV